MPLFFARLKVGWPDPLRRPPDRPNSWRVYVVCTGNDERTSTTLQDVRNLGSIADKQAARNSYDKLLNRAQTGATFSALYDETECHEAFSFRRDDGSEEKVWRIWGNSKTRLYFIYLPDRRIVLLKTLAKREDRLSSGDQREISDLAEAVLREVEMSGFREI